MLEPGEVDGVDDFAVEEVDEEGLELDEARVGVEEFGGEVEEWFVARRRFWCLRAGTSALRRAARKGERTLNSAMLFQFSTPTSHMSSTR